MASVSRRKVWFTTTLYVDDVFSDIHLFHVTPPVSRNLADWSVASLIKGSMSMVATAGIEM